jgi:hypothetical protein
MKHTIFFALIVTLVFSSCSNHRYIPQSEQGTVDSIEKLIAHYSIDSTDSLSQALWERSGFYLFTYIKEQYGENNWNSFCELSLSNNNTVEKNLMEQYSKTVYSLAVPIHYKTEYPYSYQTLTKVDQAGYLNILYQNETSFDDRELLTPLLEIYADTILSTLVPDSTKKSLFYSKLDIMNDGFINMHLISNEQNIEATGLNFVTAFSQPRYYLGSQYHRYTNTIYSKYLSPISSITFLHELVHSVIEIDHRPIELFQIDRNRDSVSVIINESFSQKNKMIEEGVAEYVARKSSLWSMYPLFEPIHEELQFYKEINDFPFLSLDEMELYYYGKRKKSFDYIEYGLTSAHSLVHFLVEKFDMETVIQLIYVEDIEVNAETILGISWDTIMDEWQLEVMRTSQLVDDE